MNVLLHKLFEGDRGAAGKEPGTGCWMKTVMKGGL